MQAPPDAPVILGARGVMVNMGLATPLSRAFVIGTTVGLVAYGLGVPRASFNEEGEMRPLKFVSHAEDATRTHFLVVPITAAVAAYLFT